MDELELRIAKLEIINDVQRNQIDLLIKLVDNLDRNMKLHKQFILSIIEVLNLSEEERKLAEQYGSL